MAPMPDVRMVVPRLRQVRALGQDLRPRTPDRRAARDGRRTKVWIEGVPDPIVASRTETTILRDMGEEAAVDVPVLDEALDLASRLAAAADAGRVDLGDLGRRARRLLASTTQPPLPGED